jgi:hypothetical protein
MLVYLFSVFIIALPSRLLRATSCTSRSHQIARWRDGGGVSRPQRRSEPRGCTRWLLGCVSRNGYYPYNGSSWPLGCMNYETGR